MADLCLKYGNGKTVELCQTAHNYNEQNGKVAIFNANNNNEIISKLETFYNTTLRVNITDTFDNELLFEKGIRLKKRGVSVILVDNAHFLSSFDVKQLYLIAKILDIRVVCFADRYHNNQELEGAVRLFELANIVNIVDGDYIGGILPTTTFIYGAMNSSKTSSLLITGKDLESKGKKVVYIKPISDRNPIKIISRVGVEKTADLVLYPDSLITNCDFFNNSIVLVDEAQFLSPLQIDSLIAIAKQKEIKVTFYGLKTDFQSNTFPGSKRLFFVADSLRKLDTYCVCKGNPQAEFNARKDKRGNFIKEGEQVAIDGQNCSYTSLCSCYLNKVWGYPRNPNSLVKRLTIEKKVLIISFFCDIINSNKGRYFYEKRFYFS